MIKTSKILPIVIVTILVTNIGIVFGDNQNPVQSILQSYSNQFWYVGDNLGPYDTYNFHICDERLVIKSEPVDPSNPCYSLTLNFMGLLKSPTGDTYIVQAVIIGSNNITHYCIFQISKDTFQIITGADEISQSYAKSVQNTLLYLIDFTNIDHKKSLIVGSIWGTVNAYVNPEPSISVTDHTNFVLGQDHPTPFAQSLDAYKVSYQVGKESYFMVSNEVPFPVYANVYDPVLIFSNTQPLFTISLDSFEHGSASQQIIGQPQSQIQLPIAVHNSTTNIVNVTSTSTINSTGVTNNTSAKPDIIINQSMVNASGVNVSPDGTISFPSGNLTGMPKNFTFSNSNLTDNFTLPDNFTFDNSTNSTKSR